MQTKQRLFSRILLPSLLAVLFFMAAIYLFVIPNYRESLMDGKRETIRELTNTAWSVMHKLNLMVSPEFTIADAQKEAVMIVSDMRYGEEFKDYFWITDTLPRMVMHPYRPMLNGKDLTNYRDPRGKNFFVDIVNVVKENGDGYVDYKWQWKDDSLTVVPKLSYVKAFKPWGWIVGTGIYIEDVNRQISNLTRKVVWISVFITILIGAVIIYLARRNYIAEIERQCAQDRLRDSMQRYKKLVEASTDGVLMVIENEIVYCNPYLLNLLGYSQGEYDQQNGQLFETLRTLIGNQKKHETEENSKTELASELKVPKKAGFMVDVVVNQSKFDIEGKQGVICAVKDVSKHKDVERELDLSMEKFKSIANLLKVGIFRCTLGRNARFIEMNTKGLELLGFSLQTEIKDAKLQELFEAVDERKEVVRAISEGVYIKERLLRLKRADGTVLSALVSLYPVTDLNGKLVFCDGIIIDAYDHLCRDSSFSKGSSTHQLSANVLLQPIKNYLLAAPQCELETPAAVASKLMTSAKSDIALVVNDKLTVMGIITHSDISRRVVSGAGNPSIPVSEIMSAPVITVSDNDMVMDAFALMVQHKVSYVVVKSSENKKPAYISLISLSELRKDTPEFFINSITKAQSVYELAEIYNQVPRLVKNLIESGTGVAAAGKLISKVSDSITEKLIADAILQLGPPPAPFVFIALGSEGRREQTLATDQDNAIVYQLVNPNQEPECKKYFLALGGIVCGALSKTGYPLCKGGVMAMNSEWCMNYNDWENAIANWVNIPNPQEILNISIFFDFRPIYGDFELADKLQQFCSKTLKDNSLFFFNLAKSIINLKPSAIESQSSNEGYDIKLPLLAINSIARLWSLKYGIGERNTLERFFALEALGAISTSLRGDFEQGFGYVMLLRIKNQLRQIEANETPTNEIKPRQLSDFDRIMLKRVMATISAHVNRIAIDFRLV